MPYKLNVIADCWKGHFISPRKVREHLFTSDDGRMVIYLTDFWLFHSRPGRPYKYRHAAALVVKLSAHGDLPESCWEVANCSRLTSREDAASYYAVSIRHLINKGFDRVAAEMAAKWKEGKFIHRPHRQFYCAVSQEERTDAPAGPHYKTFEEVQRMRIDHVLKDKNGKIVKQLGRERPSFRTLAREFGDRCKKEGLAIFRNEGDKTVLVGHLHREE